MLRIRDAAPADLPAIRGLFNALIPTTTVTWRDDVAGEAEIAAWFADRQAAGDPVLVAEVDAAVVGYTAWSTFRRYPGYRHTVELTIHVDADHHGQGIGRALLEGLVQRARRHDVHVLVAAVDGANTGSIEFHLALGFAEVARMPEVGRKHDRWLDLVLMQLVLE